MSREEFGVLNSAARVVCWWVLELTFGAFIPDFRPVALELLDQFKLFLSFLELVSAAGRFEAPIVVFTATSGERRVRNQSVTSIAFPSGYVSKLTCGSRL